MGVYYWKVSYVTVVAVVAYVTVVAVVSLAQVVKCVTLVTHVTCGFTIVALRLLSEGKAEAGLDVARVGIACSSLALDGGEIEEVVPVEGEGHGVASEGALYGWRIEAVLDAD